MVWKKLAGVLVGAALAVVVGPCVAFADTALPTDGAGQLSDDLAVAAEQAQQGGALVADSQGDGAAGQSGFSDGALSPDTAAEGAQQPSSEGDATVFDAGIGESQSDAASEPLAASGAAALFSGEDMSGGEAQDDPAPILAAAAYDAGEAAGQDARAAESQDAQATAARNESAKTDAPQTSSTAAAAKADPAVTVLTAGSVMAPSGETDDKNYFDNESVYRISIAKVAQDTVVVDVAGASTKAGANVQLYRANNTLAQYWRAVNQGNGIYRFVVQTSNNLLAWSGSAAIRSNVATAASGNVDWYIKRYDDGTFSLSPASNTNLMLDAHAGKTANGTNLWLYESNGSSAQRFFFTKSEGLTAAYKAGKSATEGIVELALASNQGLRADVAGQFTANQANVLLAADSTNMSQKFMLSYAGNGLYELQDVNSSKYLDVAAGSTKPGANVQQYSRNKTLAQFWYLEKSDSGYAIKSSASALALTAASASAGANLAIDKATGSANQVFTIKQSQLVDDGTYVIQSAIIMPMVLDVRGASTSAKANVQTYRSNGTAAQQFTIKHVGGGVYTIQNVNSGLYIDVAGASTKAGGNVWQYDGNGTNAQKWIIELGGDGTLLFKSVNSGKYLDVAGANPRRGANVHQWGSNGSDAQKWVLHDKDWKFYPNSTTLSDLSIMVKAEQYEGWEYQWGGRSPATSFDCAGLVMYCANEVWGTNYDLIYTNADRLYSLCTPISASEAKVGDFVFYRGTYGSDVNYISHVVLYAGNGIMYGAGDPIGYAKVNSIRNIRRQPAQVLYARAKR